MSAAIHIHRGRCALLAVVCLGFAPVADGATRTWTGALSDDWIDGSANNLNWNPADEPDSDDTAVFSSTDSVDMGSVNTVLALTMSGGSSLSTNGHGLTVDGLAQLAGVSTDLFVEDGSLIIADSLTINSDAEVHLRNGNLLIVEETGDGLLDVNVGGELTGYGVILLGDSPAAPTTLMVLDGELTATGVSPNVFLPPPAATLQIIANNANGRINLDGSGGGGDGIVTVGRNATLDVNVPMSDVFDGTINLGANSTLDISPAWTFAGGGVSDLNVNSGAGSNASFPALPAHIAGSQLTQTGGTITLDQADETLVFDAPFVQTGGTLANSGTIVFNANAQISGGAFSMTGPAARITVNPNVTVSISSDDFDLDGDQQSGNYATIGSGAKLDLSLSGSADESFDSYIHLNGGVLEVTTSDNAWAARFVDVGANTGSSAIDGESTTLSTLTVGENSSLSINVPVTFDPARVEVHAGAHMFLTGPITYNQDASGIPSGRELTGAGRIVQANAATVVSETRITVDTYDWDGGPTTITPDGRFSLTVGNIDSGNDTYDNQTINVNGGYLGVTVADGAWILGEGADLNLTNASSDIAILAGSAVRVAGGQIDVDGDSTISAAVTLAANAPITLVDDGVLTLIGQLTLEGGDVLDSINRSTSTSQVDLHGGLLVHGVSTVDVEFFNWRISPTTITASGALSILADHFDGTIEQLYDNTLTINGGNLLVELGDHDFWTLDGELHVLNAATVSGDAIVVGNGLGSSDANLNVNGAGPTTLDVELVFSGDADVNIAAGATLNTPRRVSFQSVGLSSTAEFTGGGGWLFGGFVDVDEDTTIDMPAGMIDLDGGPTDTVGGDVTINAPLIVNAATMASFGNVNTISVNRIYLNNGVTEFGFATGSLTVNLTDPDDSWTVNPGATMQIIGNPATGNVLDGSPLNMNGQMLVFGHAKVGSRLNIGSTGVVTIANSSSSLRLTAFPHRISDGVINGIGLLAADGNSALHGFGEISAPIDFDGNADLKAEDGVLTVNGAISDVDEIGATGALGVLNVTNPWNTNVANALQLEGGEVRGQPITNDGLIRGFGLVGANQVINNGTIAALGGELVLDRAGTTAGYDWDGAADNGALEAVAGDLILRAANNTSFGGSMAIGGPFELFVDGFEIEHDSSASLAFNGGVYRSNAVQRFGGATSVATGVSQLDAPASFLLTSVNDVDGTLQLRRNTSIAAGANFHDGGALVTMSGATLTLHNGASVGVTLENQGVLELGASPGQATVAHFTQTAAGAWNLELGGVAANQYDRLTVLGEAELAGALNLAVLPGFTPALGQTFNILTAAGGVTGSFSAVSPPLAMPIGLSFDVIYGPTLVQLAVINTPVFTADFDADGDVDGADLVEWRGDFGVNDFSDADDDGDSDGADFLAWQRELGGVSLAAAGVGSSMAVPAPATGLLAVMGGFFLLFRRLHFVR